MHKQPSQEQLIDTLFNLTQKEPKNLHAFRSIVNAIINQRIAKTKKQDRSAWPIHLQHDASLQAEDTAQWWFFTNDPKRNSDYAEQMIARWYPIAYSRAKEAFYALFLDREKQEVLKNPALGCIYGFDKEKTPDVVLYGNNLNLASVRKKIACAQLEHVIHHEYTHVEQHLTRSVINKHGKDLCDTAIKSPSSDFIAKQGKLTNAMIPLFLDMLAMSEDGEWYLNEKNPTYHFAKKSPLYLDEAEAEITAYQLTSNPLLAGAQLRYCASNGLTRDSSLYPSYAALAQIHDAWAKKFYANNRTLLAQHKAELIEEFIKE